VLFSVISSVLLNVGQCTEETDIAIPKVKGIPEPGTGIIIPEEWGNKKHMVD
jgi:hypothetical protein